ncbi:MAG: FAD-dependent oxidoreductase [Erysipelotrichaceae bacterium]|nr:FAD-dependent oxidoreductase [Erysipelotrichaceae bacterium]
MEHSIWEDYRNKKTFPSIDKDYKTDVLIIGGGIAGILCAYELKKRNIDYILVDKNYVGSGISKNTTAFISFIHDFSYYEMISKLGINKAKEYIDLCKAAMKKYEELALLYDFDYEKKDLYLYSMDEDKIINEKIALELLKVNVSYVNKLEVDDSFNKAIKIKDQAIINPLKLIDALANELNIFEHSNVSKVYDNEAICNNHIISFNHVIMASNYPLVNKKGLYFMKLRQKRSYVVAINKQINQLYINIDDDGLYYRPYKEYMIVGGNDRLTNKKCENNFYLQMKEKYKGEEIKYYWSNQDCISLDQIPYIGRFNNAHNNWYVTTGYNLYGFTFAMSSSRILADMIEGKLEENPYLLTPARSILHKKLISSLAITISNLFSLKVNRCTHMGCALKYNEIDDTFECPCHGSRYDKNGKLLNGPAQKDLEIK